MLFCTPRKNHAPCDTLVDVAKQWTSEQDQQWTNEQDQDQMDYWETATVPTDAICRMYGHSFRGSTDKIGEPTVQWIIDCAGFPAEGLDEESFWPVFMGFEISRVLSSNHAAFFGLMNGSGESSTRIAKGGIVLKETTNVFKERAQRNWWRDLGRTLGSLLTYMKLRSQFGPVELFENDKYKEQMDRLEKVGVYMEDTMQQLREELGPSEADGPYWYVKLVGVHPSAQGQGVGKRIMSKLNGLADKHHRDCYLETSGERNVAFYKSLGYEEVGPIVFKDPTGTFAGEYRGVAMLRPHRGIVN